MSSARLRLIRIQKRLYRKLQDEADALLGRPNLAIRRYLSRYERDIGTLGGRLAFFSKEDLVAEIRRADVTFIGDYHSFAQAQRTALRLMMAAVKPGENWCVGLEMIPSHHQGDLDLFQNGQLTAEQFLVRIRYREEWGFPWNHYAPIFAWAREKGVKLIALNRPKMMFAGMDSRRLGESELLKRDQWAAGILTDLLHDSRNETRVTERTRPQALRVIVLYGELHVSQSHLPFQFRKIARAFIGKPPSCISIHQNHERLYWRVASTGRQLRTDAARIREGVFGVFSSTPWAQLQSLISFMEADSEAGDDDHQYPRTHGRDDESDDDGSEPDYHTALSSYASTIAEFLGVRMPALDSISLRTIEDADFAESLPSGSELSRREISLLKKLVSANHRFYLPGIGVAYLGSPSLNALAELAARCLHRTLTRSRGLHHGGRDDFFRHLLESTFAFFGSLLINPRRKCDLERDHSRRLRELRQKADESHPDEPRMREFCIAFLKWDLACIKRKSAPAFPIQLDRACMTWATSAPVVLAAEEAGKVVGKRVHEALISERVTVEWVRDHLLAPGKPPSSRLPIYELRYLEIAEALRGLPALASKSEVL